MNWFRNVLLSAVLAFSCLTLLYAAEGDRVIYFDDAVVLLAQTPCDMGSEPKADEELKAGRAVFTDASSPPFRLCWVEEAGLIWVLDDQLRIWTVPVERAVPADTPRKPKTNIKQI